MTSKPDNPRQEQTPDEKAETRIIKFGGIITLVVWTIILGSSAAWNCAEPRRSAIEEAVTVASSAIDKDIAYIRWAAAHGGVYVESTDRTPPNPWLRIPNKDASTADGKRLTLLSPTHALREVMSDFSDLRAVNGRIVSTEPLNPSNKATPDEELAIRLFEAGSDDRHLVERTKSDGTSEILLIRPLLADASCLKCHAASKAKIGAPYGAISATVQADTGKWEKHKSPLGIVVIHASLWIIGAAIITLIAGAFVRNKKQLREVIAKLRLTACLQVNMASRLGF